MSVRWQTHKAVSRYIQALWSYYQQFQACLEHLLFEEDKDLLLPELPLTLRSGAAVAMAAAVAAAMVVAESTSLPADLESPPAFSLFSVGALPKSCTFTSLWTGIIWGLEKLKSACKHFLLISSKQRVSHTQHCYHWISISPEILTQDTPGNKINWKHFHTHKKNTDREQ